ncbi:hypothetical protein [uncultured Dysosmobacter sp.]|uniref:hypothetical protein n=1 Tax=uncultured Dysosmobacter sp. TaxID=2591384 RepID=UPI00262286D7|nr:hypothetical protein [uncultured Dysosmobacter sp.]
MQDLNALLDALDHLKVETGSLACFGCGHEHNCSVHGCAIIRQAEDALRQCAAALRESEAARAELGRRLAEARKQADELTKACSAATDKANRAIAERQALERDLASCLSENCTYCRHNGDNPECDCECLECRLPCYCRDCVNGSKFQWRGAGPHE